MLKQTIISIFISSFFLAPNLLAATNNQIQASTTENQHNFQFKLEAAQIEEEIFGLGFQLHFDPQQLEFQDYQTGNFFEQGGDQPIYLVSKKESAQESVITVGISMKNGDILAKDSGKIISLNFLKKSEIDPKISLSNTIAKNSKAENIQLNWPELSTKESSPNQLNDQLAQESSTEISHSSLPYTEILIYTMPIISVIQLAYLFITREKAEIV